MCYRYPAWLKELQGDGVPQRMLCSGVVSHCGDAPPKPCGGVGGGARAALSACVISNDIPGLCVGVLAFQVKINLKKEPCLARWNTYRTFQ